MKAIIKSFAWPGGLAAVTAMGLLFHHRIEDRWEEFLRRADALKEELAKVDPRRPVLYGEAIPGDAWADYRSAMVRSAGNDRDLVKQGMAHDPDAWERLLAPHGETLALLYRGAHRQEFSDPFDWSQGFVGGIDIEAMWSLARLAVLRFLQQVDAGQPVDGVETLLDAAQLGRDLMEVPHSFWESIGQSVVRIALLRPAESGHLLEGLSPAALEKLADGLRMLDRNLSSTGRYIHGDAAQFGLQAQDWLPDVGTASSQAWRHMFSTRLMWANTGLRTMDRAEEIAGTGGAWSTLEPCLAEIEGDQRPFISWPWGSRIVPGRIVKRLEVITRLRLVRMAIEYRRGGSVSPLRDPFGGDLRHSVGEDGDARFWSTGAERAKSWFSSKWSGWQLEIPALKNGEPKNGEPKNGEPKNGELENGEHGEH